MELLQARVPKEMIKMVERLVKTGRYTTKSEVIRDALRLVALNNMIGKYPDDGKDSVTEIKKIRKILSARIKSFKDIEEINKLAE
jgi:putative addiction module CopG family antidote